MYNSTAGAGGVGARCRLAPPGLGQGSGKMRSSTAGLEDKTHTGTTGVGEGVSKARCITYAGHREGWNRGWEVVFASGLSLANQT